MSSFEESLGHVVVHYCRSIAGNSVQIRRNDYILEEDPGLRGEKIKVIRWTIPGVPQPTIADLRTYYNANKAAINSFQEKNTNIRSPFYWIIKYMIQHPITVPQTDLQAEEYIRLAMEYMRQNFDTENLNPQGATSMSAVR